MGAFLLGLVVGASLAWPFMRRRDCYWREFNARRRNSNGNCVPMPPAPPYSSAAIAWQAEAEARPSRAKFIDPSIQRIYRGAMWREKGSDTWHPLGKEPDWAEFARLTVKVQGLNWPATLGDFTLVGPADNQGAWRWYERQRNGTTERVRVDHQLQPLGRTTPPPGEP